MTRIAPALSFALGLSAPGCVVYDDTHGPPPASEPAPEPEPNYAPYVNWAEAGAYWDDYNWDYIWYFEADVDDPNSPTDVVAVYADVYDGYSGEWVDSFELYPTNDEYYWFSDWLGSSTWLDPYYDGYVVDIVAYDAYDAYDTVSIYPYTY